MGEPKINPLDAIGATGRIPAISKHRAINYVHIKSVVEALDAAGMKEAADTIVWGVWWRVLDEQRHDFLLADQKERLTAEHDWQPIATAARPDEGARPVLLLQDGRRFIGEWDGSAGQWQGLFALGGVEREAYFQEWPGKLYSPSHWAPLLDVPAPPSPPEPRDG